MTTSNPYRGFRFPAEVIQQAVWLYHGFSLSLRDVGGRRHRDQLREHRKRPVKLLITHI